MHVIIALLLFMNIADLHAETIDSAPPKLVRISPSGEDVLTAKEIVLQFASAVAPVGRMERKDEEVPVYFEPSVQCEWRWLNTTSLSCQLGEKTQLKPATEYKIKTKDSTIGVEGQSIKKAVEIYLNSKGPSGLSKNLFITQRPKITSYDFRRWLSFGSVLIDIQFNQTVKRESLAKHLYFKDEKSTRYPVEFHSTNEKDPAPEEERVFTISPQTELPLDSTINLHAEPGIVSVSGPLESVDDRVIVSFDTYPEFKFVGIQCCSEDHENSQDCYLGSSFQVAVNASWETRCNPQDQVALQFSAPVTRKTLKKVLESTPQIYSKNEPKAADHTSEIDEGTDEYEEVYYSGYEYDYEITEPHKKGRNYRVTLPYGLKAYSEYKLHAKKEDLRDVFKRPLPEDLNTTILTDHRVSRMVFNSRFSVLEKDVRTHLPVAIQNLDSLNLSYGLISANDKRSQLSADILVDKPLDLSYFFPLKVRDFIPGGSGLIYGSLTSKPASYQRLSPDYFVSEVTPFDVHVKLGHYNTLVWVTTLDSGKPVSDATVSIYTEGMYAFANPTQSDSSAKTEKDGVAMLPGTSSLDPLQKIDYYWYPYSSKPVFKVMVKKGDDIAIVPLIGDLQMSPKLYGGGYLNSQNAIVHGHIRSWGTTPQGIYKLGQNIQYKIYVRDQGNQRFFAPPSAAYALRVYDPMGKTVYERRDITLSKFGAFDGEFAVPDTGAVGIYSFVLGAVFEGDKHTIDKALDTSQSWRPGVEGRTWKPLQVLVSDFTPAAFHVTTELRGDVFKVGDTLNATSNAKLHSGGPYGEASARITAQIFRRSITSDYEKFKSFHFGPLNTWYYDNDSSAAYGPTIYQSESNLNTQGQLDTQISLSEEAVKSASLYGTLTVESAVRDERGKYIANQASSKFVARDRYVGVNFPSWTYEKNKPMNAEFVVINENGETVSGVNVQLALTRHVTKASRVKGPGNAYVTHYETSEEFQEQKSVTSGANPTNVTFVPKSPGRYFLEATTTDTNGKIYQSKIGTWVIGSGNLVWQTEDGNSMDILPETTSAKVGSKLKILVKNPLPGALGLITIERYGVIKRWTEKLKTTTPVIEVPVTADMIPGFYVSVVAVSPRISQPLGEGEVDLGKPLVKMGYAKIDVESPEKGITVTVSPNRQLFKPQESVSVRLSSKLSDGEKRPIEYAVAVLDESVFDLISSGMKYFDPYKGFYTLDPLDLRNYNLLLELIGRRNFHKKGANSGGDGMANLGKRSLFKFVAYWNPSLAADTNGNAKFDFTLPDNLTGWKILAMAITPDDRMGVGTTSIKVNKPTEIRPALLNQVIEGDSFDGAFTVMNRSKDARSLSVTVKAKGNIDSVEELHQSIEAKPYERYTIKMPVKANHDGSVTFEVFAGDSADSDSIDFTIPVLKRQSVEAAATYGTFDSPDATEKYAFPENMRTDIGKVSVVLSPSVIVSVEGAFRYMKEYSYLCWEQQITKGTMAAFYLALKKYMASSFEWGDADAVVKQTLLNATHFQAPNGGMTFYVAKDEYVDPYLSAFTAIAFNWLRDLNYSIPTDVEQNLHQYLKTILRQNALPTFYSAGMAATARAVALAALSEDGKLNAGDINRYLPAVPEMSLFGKAHMVMALTKVNGDANNILSVIEKIYASANETGGKFMFNDAIDTVYFSRILTTPLRDNCAVLSAFLKFEDYTKTHPTNDPGYGKDVPYKLVRTITQTRKNKDHWENTQENLFCMYSLIDYSKRYESTAPNGTWDVSFDKEKIGSAKFTDLKDSPVEVVRPIKPSDPGKAADLNITRAGIGRAYYAARLFYSPQDLRSSPVNAGIEIHREYSVERNGKFELLSSPFNVKQGELVRVDIYVSVPAARNFVVVNDPVPGGLEPVNKDLGTASKVDAEKGEFSRAGGSYWYRFFDWRDYASSRWSFYHQELRNDSVRFYSEYLPIGNYSLSYTAQAIASGEFAALPTHAEELYDPDVYGQWVPETLKVVQ